MATADERIDYAGIATLSLALVALLVALDQATDWGWGDPRIIALLAIFVVLLPVFVAIERADGSQRPDPARRHRATRASRRRAWRS